MLSQLPKYSQRDPKWSAMKLGQSGLSMADWGCTITASASAGWAFGKKFTPGTLCAAMSNEGGFDRGGSLNWLVLSKVLGIDFGYRWDTNANVQPNHSLVLEPAALLHVEWLATQVGYPTICWVDTDHDGKANHWGTYLGEGMFLDPWDGQVKSMLSVFKRLYGYAIFNGDPVNTGTKVSALVAKANDISRGRNIELNASEIMQTVNRA